MDLSNVLAALPQTEKDSRILYAILYGETETISMLITAGANVNAKHTACRVTALMAACIARNYKPTIVSALIAAGAAVNAADATGNTALMMAAKKGRTTTISVLLDAGANINAENESGHTALEIASSNDRRDTAFRLLSAMRFKEVLAIQPNTVRNLFAGKCLQAVLDVQRDIFSTLWVFNRKGLTNEGPMEFVLPYLSPEWYSHRLNSDTILLTQKLMDMLRAKEALNTPLALAVPTFIPTAGMAALTIDADSTATSPEMKNLEPKRRKQNN
jgi:hypothetical protein